MSKIFQWGPRLLLAVMFFSMSVPKFLAPDITVYIFTELGVEPWGRILTGLVEFTIASMLIFPKSYAAGIAGSIVVLSGALLSHLFILGIVISNQTGEIDDGGVTFLTAIFMLALTIMCFKQFRKQSNQDIGNAV